MDVNPKIKQMLFTSPKIKRQNIQYIHYQTPISTDKQRAGETNIVFQCQSQSSPQQQSASANQLQRHHGNELMLTPVRNKSPCNHIYVFHSPTTSSNRITNQKANLRTVSTNIQQNQYTAPKNSPSSQSNPNSPVQMQLFPPNPRTQTLQRPSSFQEVLKKNNNKFEVVSSSLLIQKLERKQKLNEVYKN